MGGWLERIGAPLVTPRAGMQRAVQSPAGRGAADVTLLVLMAWIAEQLPGLVRAFYRGRELGLGAGLQTVMILLYNVLPIAVAVLVAALVLSVLAGRRTRASEGPARADAIDLAAYSAVPFVFVTTGADLVIAAGNLHPSPAVATVVLGAGLGWALVPWLFAVVALRSDRSAA